jgi:hypothetical protein
VTFGFRRLTVNVDTGSCWNGRLRLVQIRGGTSRSNRSTFGELAGISARAHHFRRFLNSGPLRRLTGPEPTLPVIDVEHGGIGLLEEPLQDLDESGGLL